MSPPDSTIALLSGSGDITTVFGVPPFQNQQLEKDGIHTVLNSYDVFGDIGEADNGARVLVSKPRR